jgi:mRNA interferase MazF
MARVRARPRRGDVFWVDLDPARGTEIRKTRPAVVVSNDSCNKYGRRVVVVPVTSNTESMFPGEALVTIQGKPSRALGDQIRSVDKSRLRTRLASLGIDDMIAVEEALLVTLGMTRW